VEHYASAFRAASWLVLGWVFVPQTAWAQNTVPPSPTAVAKPVLRVAFEATAEPFSFVDSRGKPAGFSVDLVTAIAQQRGLEVEFIVRPWAEILETFSGGNLDVIANIAYLPERTKHFDFSIPHASLEGAVFVRKGSKPLTALRDLAGRRIAVGKESVGHLFTRRHGLEGNLVFYSSLQDCLTSLEDGRIEAVIASRPIALKMARELGLSKIEASSLALPDLRYELHMAVPKGRSEVLYQLNLGIQHLHHTGVYDQLYEKWLGPIEARQLRWRDLEPYWLPSLLVILALGAAFIRQRQLLQRLRRQAAALRHSEERLMLSLEGSREAFWDWDLKTNRVVRSPRWAEILGYERHEIPEHISALTPWLHPDDAAAAEACKRRMMEGHGRIEYRVRARDNTWKWIFDRASVVARDSNGTPLRVTGVATDITERKETEAALVRSQKLLEQTQETAQVGGWEYDLRSGTMYWTAQAYRIHELEPGSTQVNLERATEFFVSSARPPLRRAMEAAIRDGTPFDLELELSTAKQQAIWVRISGRAEWDSGRVMRLHGCYQDISNERRGLEERQRLQLKMLEAQKLESLGVLAGGIAHDFNNLLTVVLGNASLARQESSTVPEALSQIEMAAQRAAELCRQMLAYAGKSRFRTELLDLNVVVSDTLKLLRLSISKSATLQVALHREQLPVEADASQIRQVVMNLMINASEALGGGNGRIRLSTTEVRLSREALRDARLGQECGPGDYVGLQIEDEGCGMSPDTLRRIFDPFFTTKFTGRGLGLAAVVGVVRVHRGVIFVSSAPGRGTTFRILLPKSTKALLALPQAKTPESAPAAAEGTILVVDDESDVRRVAAAMLERQGYSVAIASDGYEALALGLAHGGRFTAVLLDLMMPGLDGPGTLKELRAMNSALPVLLMSGFSEEDARNRLPAGDALIGFLPKPFTTEDLVQALNRLRLQEAPEPRAATS
jgi:two-component system, cell cycle sensor histidine kinase and response regulator CckA